ncbi:aconitase X [Phytoactinopolyspora halotolerans]|uniref:DUF521 domain-containing protein n=1 Tax=Phytoactinopolyspora halotolerans TaxID=1981512 RepID=A0A6L9SGX9_9ACTN|nr:aconitase X catalytic domain-containing protein [Phytoactinopolyspora halotolerans]NEE03340.1 DUF521 domain-containing protein [Phytoactinopolyspora halotolerans]
MNLTDEERGMLAGEHGEALKWAMTSQVAVGTFFGADRMVPITGVHMMGDMEVMGASGFEFLERLVGSGARARVPTTTNARCVDFDHALAMRQENTLVEQESALLALLRDFGAMLTDTCINYQTVYQPSPGEHLAWGDTGTVIYANSVCGAHSNFESGPAAVAAALTGRTPAYGFHLESNRRGQVLVDVDAPMPDVTDWGVLGAIVGARYAGYARVPVFDSRIQARADELKHLGASLASYGSMGMFHLVSVTPEAPSVDAAFDGTTPTERLRVTGADIQRHLANYRGGDRADVVVLTAPQLSLFELQRAAELLDGRRVAEHTDLIITTNFQNREAAVRLGYVDALESAGAIVLSGVCWYLMGLHRLREAFSWSTLVTNSAKAANIVGGYRLDPRLRRTEQCIEAAVTGVVPDA